MTESNRHNLTPALTVPLTPAEVSAHKAARAKKRLLHAAQRNPDTLLIQYDTSMSGYDAEQVDDMREEYGVNAITHQHKNTFGKRLLSAFINPFTLVLVVLALISAFTDDWAAVIIVLVMINISGILRFVQEMRSNNAAEKLSEMVATTVTVQRQIVDKENRIVRTTKAEIPLAEIVVGDLVYLAAGDMIPADVRLLRAKDLFVGQSALTGESEPVEKFAAEIADKSTDPLELNNLAFMGSNVVSGSALVMAIAVGDETYLGTLAQQLQDKKPPTSFEKGVNSVSWVLIRFMLVMVPIVLFVNGFTKGDWTAAFLFAVSVAVGLTPEMLPMIVSANLAKGAVSMAKKKVIVKDLNSIQNFGAMDVLCTDKTGTLTQDKVILEYHLDIHGNEDQRVLRHAFLNSYYQTGLKNLMDHSILEYAQRIAMTDEAKNYHKVDEIPFDFNRRRMSVVVADQNGKTELITKGAIEEMLACSAHAEYQGKIEPLTPELRREILTTANQYNADGMRVLGIAHKKLANACDGDGCSVADESEMILIGYLTFLDPPKDSAAEALKILQNYGVAVKVLTGDNDAVTRCVCRQVGITNQTMLLGSDIETMDDIALHVAVEKTAIFAKLSPQQKARIVQALRENHHTVGFMGDGINDAAAMKAADVGISVDTAVDIAKESANIILLEKDLNVLGEGVIEGRKIYANIIKYIKMTASSNFGNMFSVLAASAFLPFLPMLPLQILILNLIYDIACIAFPWDNVDHDYLKKPRKWDATSISRFMLWLGPTSSVFDLTTYLLLFYYLCPQVLGGAYHTLTSSAQTTFAQVFHTGWFVESLCSQILVIHMLRTPKLPFIQSSASWPLIAMTTGCIIIGTVLPYTVIGEALDLMPLPLLYFPCLLATICGYMTLATLFKKIFVRRYGELL